MKIHRLPSVTPTDQALDSDLPLDDQAAPPNSIFRGLPPNDPIHVLVRVYVVKVSYFCVLVKCLVDLANIFWNVSEKCS